jgi:hypothetical protein
MEKRQLHEVARLRLRDRLLRGFNATGEAAESAEPWMRNLAQGISFEQVEGAYSADPHGERIWLSPILRQR